MLPPYETLIQPVIQRARRQPDSPALIFIPETGPEETICAADFHAEAVAYAQALKAAGVGPEDLVILVLRHSRVLLSAFWGALYLGAIASIFPFLTEKLDPKLYKERVRELVTLSKARAVITFPEFKADLTALLEDAGCPVLSTADVTAQAGETSLNFEPPAFSPEKTAFLQHSSGTTGLQKGVALSHRSVLNQVRAYSQAIKLSPDDVVVSWLPLYHDMGLIAGFVMPLLTGNTLVLMSPFQWVRDPKLLFQAVQRHQGTLCWLPNFAYNHSVRGISRRSLAGLDVSTLRAVINCSEPVRFDSHRLFVERFGSIGIRPETLATCYAMAENTFAVTQSEIGQPPRVDWVVTRTLQEDRRAEPAAAGAAGATPMVSCGECIPGTETAIAAEDGRHLPERHVGEVILRSDCMLTEIYRRPDLTAKLFKDGWYNTGDMGYLADGQLYITGRKKDLIIVGGKNIYPQDLEAIANLVPGLNPGRSVAFGVYDEGLGSEDIVMVCELEADSANSEAMRAIGQELRARIVQQTEVVLSDVRLVDRRWLIKTSSGKIARSDNREKYLREMLPGE